MFQIRYALAGGFGGCIRKDWEDMPYAQTMEEAEKYALKMACEEYETYDRLIGLRSIDMIMQEDGVDEKEAAHIWADERDSWLDYEAREI